MMPYKDGNPTLGEQIEEDARRDYYTKDILADAREDRADIKRLRGLLWYAWREFNAIRARDGAPEGVDHGYWDQITQRMREELGDDAQPWPSKDAEAVRWDVPKGDPK